MFAIIILLVIVAVISAIIACFWIVEVITRDVSIRFSDFRKWYQIAPGKWDLCEYHVYRGDTRQSVSFTTPFGMIAYLMWRRKLKKQQTKIKDSKQMERLLLAVQNDINCIRNQSTREINRAILVMNKIKHI